MMITPPRAGQGTRHGRVSAAAALLAAGLLLGGCSGSESSTSGAPTRVGDAAAYSSEEAADRAGGAPAASPADAASELAVSDQKLIRSASISLQVKNIAQAMGQVRGVMAGFDGGTLSENVGSYAGGEGEGVTPDTYATVTMSVRRHRSAGEGHGTGRGPHPGPHRPDQRHRPARQTRARTVHSANGARGHPSAPPRTAATDRALSHHDQPDDRARARSESRQPSRGFRRRSAGGVEGVHGVPGGAHGCDRRPAAVRHLCGRDRLPALADHPSDPSGASKQATQDPAVGWARAASVGSLPRTTPTRGGGPDQPASEHQCPGHPCSHHRTSGSVSGSTP